MHRIKENFDRFDKYGKGEPINMDWKKHMILPYEVAKQHGEIQNFLYGSLLFWRPFWKLQRWEMFFICMNGHLYYSQSGATFNEVVTPIKKFFVRKSRLNKNNYVFKIISDKKYRFDICTSENLTNNVTGNAKENCERLIAFLNSKMST